MLRGSKGIWLLIICGIVLIGCRESLVSVVHRALHASGDVTFAVDSLGAPLAERYPEGEQVYARNPWELTVFEGRLFVGGGFANNIGPAANAGPVPVMAYNLDTETWHQEGSVPEHQVNRFIDISGELYIPGNDPQRGQHGSIYRRNGDWSQIQPPAFRGASHIYDIALFDGRLYVPTRDGQYAMSADGGQSWSINTTFTPCPVQTGFSHFRLDGTFFLARYIVGRSFLEGEPNCVGLFRHVGDHQFEPVDSIAAEVVFPEAESTSGSMQAVEAFRNGIVYLQRRFSEQPGGPFYMASLGDVHPVGPPAPGWIEDMAIQNGALYVLNNAEQSDGTVQISVWRTFDLRQWGQILSHTVPTFARSFAMDNGDIYVGLGSRVDVRDWTLQDISPATGRILRFRPTSGHVD